MDSHRRTMPSEATLGSSAMPPMASTSGNQSYSNRLGVPRQSMAPQNPHIAHSRFAPSGPSHVQYGVTEGATSATNFSQANQRSTVLPGRSVDSRDSMASGSRGDGGMYGRAPQIMRSSTLTVRRSSVFPSIATSRSSLALGTFTSVVRDIRPVRDKGFQANCTRNVGDYLVLTRYPAPVTPKTLTSPTAKEFQSIFRFLINEVIHAGLTWNKKFEDDAITILKDLRYPSMESVSKTAFTAPGSPQSWPALLAMLNWLVELSKAHENWHSNHCISDPVLMSYDELPIDHPNIEDRLLWNFSAKTYHQWFTGAIEEFSEAEHELENIYGRMMTATGKNFELFGTQLQKKNAELQQLRAQEPPLKKLEDEYIQLMSDKTKFIAFIDLHRQKAEKTKQAIAKIRAGIGSQGESLDNLRLELDHLNTAVAAQNLTPDEVNRMNHEREALVRHLDDLRTKIAEVSQSAYDQEMLVTKSMDRVESQHGEYISLGHQIGLIPIILNSQNAESATLDFRLNLDFGVEDLENLKLASSKMRTTVWQGLQAQRESYRQQTVTLCSDTIAVEDQHDRLVQQLERQRGEIGNLQVKLKMLHDQAEAAQTKITVEDAKTNKVIVQLETEVNNMLAASQEGVLATQSQLESTRIAYEEIRHRTTLLQDCLVAQVGENIDIIIRAKEHTENSLRSIRSLAETQ